MGNDLIADTLSPVARTAKLVLVNARAALFERCGNRPRPPGGHSSATALGRLLSPLEIGAAAVRTAGSRMTRRGRLTPPWSGRGPAVIRVTRLNEAARRIYPAGTVERPGRRHPLAFRGWPGADLGFLGCAPVAESVWVERMPGSVGHLSPCVPLAEPIVRHRTCRSRSRLFAPRRGIGCSPPCVPPVESTVHHRMYRPWSRPFVAVPTGRGIGRSSPYPPRAESSVIRHRTHCPRRTSEGGPRLSGGRCEPSAGARDADPTPWPRAGPHSLAVRALEPRPVRPRPPPAPASSRRRGSPPAARRYADSGIFPSAPRPSTSRAAPISSRKQPITPQRLPSTGTRLLMPRAVFRRGQTSRTGGRLRPGIFPGRTSSRLQPEAAHSLLLNKETGHLVPAAARERGTGDLTPRTIFENSHL